jgi:enoyl-CoA hydratase
MPEFGHILYEKEGPVAHVILNRPKFLNAQGHQLLDEMDQAFQLAVNDNDIRVIVLSGEGKSFSAGHDLGTPDELEDKETRNYPPGVPGIFVRFEKIYLEYGLKWRALPKPTIAMVHGYCIFGGWEISASMDMIIAAEDTKFLPGFLEYFSLPWDVGVRKAKELLFQNRFISAAKAEELGFVNRVVPFEKLKEETFALANSIAETDPFLVRMSKLSINQAEDQMGFTQAVTHALPNYIIMAQSEALRQPGDIEAGKRSLGPVDQALAYLREEEKKKEKD